MLTHEDGAALLRLARGAIEAALAGCPPPRVPRAGWVSLRRGAFVTLQQAVSGDLRGCIGRVWSDQRLGDVIPQVVVSAAQSDPRFPPVESHELPALRLEVSVLSEPVRAAADGRSVVIGRDGVLVRRGRTHAVLLPQVAREQGFAAEAFLDAACQKAGLAVGSWREPATELFTFTADVFVE